MGDLELLTVMEVVNAAGKSFNPIVDYPGEQPPFHRVDRKIETIHDYLPDRYFYKRGPPGVDSVIFLDCAKHCCVETSYLREGCKKMLLQLDKYSCHIQLEVLQHLRDNNVYVIGISAHTSHVLQPLEVTAFGQFKTFLSAKSMYVQLLSWF